MERSEHKLLGRTYPHTNCVFSLCYIAIGVGVNSRIDLRALHARKSSAH